MAEIPREEQSDLLIDVDTINGFRNQERDIVFASCMKQEGVQFLTGKQRLYSTLTIARHCLVLYGQFETLQDEVTNIFFNFTLMLFLIRVYNEPEI